jgi:hypothetical protein
MSDFLIGSFSFRNERNDGAVSDTTSQEGMKRVLAESSEITSEDFHERGNFTPSYHDFTVRTENSENAIGRLIALPQADSARLILKTDSDTANYREPSVHDITRTTTFVQESTQNGVFELIDEFITRTNDKEEHKPRSADGHIFRTSDEIDHEHIQINRLHNLEAPDPVNWQQLHETTSI